MLLVKDIIDRVRLTVHDTPEIGYDDDTLLGFINDGVRFIRRTIMYIRPELMAVVSEGTTEDGSIDLPQNLGRVLAVYADGRKLESMLYADVDGDTGTPTHFYLIGWEKVMLYPAPTKETSYKLIMAGDMTLLDYPDASPFPLDIDDFLLEYVTIRASMTNEFDMSQEQSIMGGIVNQLEDYIRNIVPAEIDVQGYWDSPRFRQHYTRRRDW